MIGFGNLLRATRYRWHPLPDAKGFLRIRDADGGWLCEFHPLGQVPTERCDGTEYRIWWEPDGGGEVISSSPYLRSVRKVKMPFSVVLGEDGMPVREVVA